MLEAGHTTATFAPLPPLFRLALVKGTAPSVLLHLRRGAHVNGRDERGLTPLMLAAGAARHEICLLLLSEGADPSAVCNAGRTAADIALANGHIGLGEALAPPSQAPAVSHTFPAPGAVGATAALAEWCHDADPEADSGWEVEAEFQAGESDGSVKVAAAALQGAMARLHGENTDTSWQELEIVLPAGASPAHDQLPPGLDAFLRHALSHGVVSPAALRRAGRGAAWLAAILDDLGIERGTGILPVRLTDIAPRRLDAGDLDRLDDAGILAASFAADRSAIDMYTRDLARLPVVDRSAEQSMFRAMHEAKHQAIRALLEALPHTKVLPSPSPVVLDDAEGHEDGPEILEDEGPADLLSGILAIHRNEAAPDFDSLVALDLDLALLDRICTDLVHHPETAEKLRLASQRYVARRNRIVTAFLPLVLKCAPWYRRPGVGTDDLVQEGAIGLLRAVERFDITRGNRFATFAIWWVRQQCGRRNEELSRTIRIPVHVIETCARLERAHGARTTDGDAAFSAILAADAGLLPERARRLASVWRRIVSLDDPKLAGYAARHADPVDHEGFTRTLASERTRIIRRAVGALPGRQEWIVRARFGLGGCNDRTLEETGTGLGVTRERVRQLEAKALQTLGSPASPHRRRLRQLL